jgi:uncharacterized protein
MHLPMFHMAFPVHRLDEAIGFYQNVLGASIGRRREQWCDIYLFGSQLTLHEEPTQVIAKENRGVRHMGAILTWQQWEILSQKLADKNVQFESVPLISHVAQQNEQAKMSLCDPSGNLIEIKAYRYPKTALELL